MAIDSQLKVSIGMPLYNAERFVAQALETILAQSHFHLEIVISDNASTDRTEDICRRYAARDRRVRYHRSERNHGAAANYNRVFELSQGEYFKWAAADDLFSADFIERCLQALEAEPRAVLSYAKTMIINEAGERLRDYEDGVDLRDPSPSARFRQFLNTVGECNAVFGLIRKDILRRTPLIGNYVGSDIVLLAELSLYGEFHEIPERLFYRRDHPKASSSNKDMDNQQDFFDPAIRGRVEMRTCRHHLQYLLAVNRAPLPRVLKLNLYGYILRHALWERHRIAEELRDYLRMRILG